ncbi:AAA family ATPase, partial [candidate division KSB1 bacterium]|nr:AAA family ATPase [candidate division KSB1 bacterium]
MIPRQLEKKVLKLLAHFPVVAILGARQVGKTTLAKMLIPRLPKENVYIDLENPADLAKLTNVV